MATFIECTDAIGRLENFLGRHYAGAARAVVSNPPSDPDDRAGHSLEIFMCRALSVEDRDIIRTVAHPAPIKINEPA